jgi:hypothetical protein
MCFRWWRMEEEDRLRVWLLYGWFTLLMCCGSCFGTIAAAARMQCTAALVPINADVSLYDAPNAEIWSLKSMSNRWESV